jgi:hypothetical protein
MLTVKALSWKEGEESTSSYIKNILWAFWFFDAYIDGEMQCGNCKFIGPATIREQSLFADCARCCVRNVLQ